MTGELSKKINEELEALAKRLALLPAKREECEKAGIHKEPVYFNLAIKAGSFNPMYDRVPGTCLYCHSHIERAPTHEELAELREFHKSIGIQNMIY